MVIPRFLGACVWALSFLGCSGGAVDSPSGIDSASVSDRDTLRAQEYVKALEKRNPNLVDRDANGEVVRVHLGDREASDEAIRLVSFIPSVQKFQLTCSRVISGEGVLPIGNLKRLRELEISVPGFRIEERFLKKVVALHDLELLRLCHVTFEGAGAEHIRKATKLKKLFLINSGIVDSDLPHIANATELEYLDLRRNSLSEKAISALARLKNLRVLGIDAPLSVTSRDIFADVTVFGNEQ